jgi:prepilin signal peptidase PulO-like enzyme (type II secretory pathway)
MEIIFGIFFFVLGAVLASFAGVISERIYTGQSWLAGRSRCNSCRRALGAADLVPVFSWFFSRGRCRTCKARVPGRYAFFEAVLGALFLISYLSYGLGLYLLVFLATLTVLAFIVLYDLRHMIVPEGSSWLLIVLCLVCAVLKAPSLISIVWVVFGAAVIGGAFFLLYFFSRGRAMGLGDAPVAFALSLLAGARAFDGILFSFWIGALIGIGVLFMRRGGPRMGIEVAFVPFLAIGFLLALFILTPWNPFTSLLPF